MDAPCGRGSWQRNDHLKTENLTDLLLQYADGDEMCTRPDVVKVNADGSLNGRVCEWRKLMSAPAFQFKGSGWYVTDYADKGRKDVGRSEGKSDAKSKTTASGGESKTSPEGSSSDATSSSSPARGHG